MGGLVNDTTPAITWPYAAVIEIEKYFLGYHNEAIHKYL